MKIKYGILIAAITASTAFATTNEVRGFTASHNDMKSWASQTSVTKAIFEEYISSISLENVIIVIEEKNRSLDHMNRELRKESNIPVVDKQPIDTFKIYNKIKDHRDRVSETRRTILNLSSISREEQEHILGYLNELWRMDNRFINKLRNPNKSTDFTVKTPLDSVNVSRTESHA